MPCEGGPTLDYKEEADKVTRLLCRLFRLLEDTPVIEVIDSELKAWWDEHKEIDRKRE